MFTNAGMVQFKNVFTGVEKRPYQRATTSQKCVRAGGKHNDLDNVGYTARHLTFFEMLGNFSFGDYFKERAIELAWKLITKDFGLKKDKLLVTVYHDDDEAAGHWKKIAGFSDDRIIRIATSDNFWAMGDTGPCGPCSEIFIDRGEHIWGGPPGSPEEDGDRFLEFWNLVFMQFEQVTKEERQPLPRPSIDTGLGLERMACILQGVDSVFETDLFRNLIDATASALGRGPQEQTVASFRVIADHLRSSAFLVADGVLPSNEGRGYVLRRIMRRAMRHAQLLGAGEPLMHRLVWALVREMGQAYPDLVRAEKLIEETLRLEETRFRKTLSRGLAILDEKSAGLKKGDMFDGDTAFTLYDTYGFPLDLTQDALKSRGISVDQASFTDAMERQRVKARASWSGSGDTAGENVWFPLREKLGATEFLGYDTESAEGVVTALVKDGKDADSLKAGESGAIVLNQTPFYAESGGQVGDTGMLTGEGVKFRVTDMQKKVGDLFVHVGTVEQGTLKVGTALQLEVDHAQALFDPRPSLGDASAARSAAAGARRSHRPARLAGGAGSPALRLRASKADHGGRARPRRGHRQRGGARKRRGDDAADGGRRRPRSRRARPVRRKIRRRGPCGLDGQGPARTGAERARLVGRTVRRHPCAPHRRYRVDYGDGRKRGGFRRAAHRGVDRASCAQACQRYDGDRKDRGVRASHDGRRHAGAHRGA